MESSFVRALEYTYLCTQGTTNSGGAMVSFSELTKA